MISEAAFVPEGDFIPTHVSSALIELLLIENMDMKFGKRRWGVGIESFKE